MTASTALRPFGGRCLLAAAALATAGPAAQAFQFDTAPDWSLRWDNTLKASTKYRVRDADPALSQAFGAGGAPQAINFNDGDQNYQRKGVFSERVDWLTELDAVWRQDFGARFSAVAWYDHKIRGTTQATDPFVSQNPLNEFPQETVRKAGREAELFDAFVFAGWRTGPESKLTVRLGRHGLQYGESLFFGDNGIARAQGPIDIDKALASPNAQFKEILRPVPQVSTSFQVSPELSIGGYYQFRWEADRLPPSGTYFSSANNAWGGSRQPEFVGVPGLANFVVAAGPDARARDSGQYGLQLKWQAADTDFGLYYARYHDKGGQIYTFLDLASLAGPVPTGQWHFVFPEGVRTWGLSATRSVGVFNVAAEASIRQNMPLRSTNMVYVSGQPLPQPAKGKTAHLNLSWLASFGPNVLAAESGLVGELGWHRVLSMDDPDHQLDASRTRDASALRLIYTPTYRQVMPGLDLGVPVGLGYTVRGQSAILASWGAAHTGNLNVGVDGTYLSVWQASLSYTRFFGRAIPFVDYAQANTFGSGNPLRDRDFIALSLRRTF